MRGKDLDTKQPNTGKRITPAYAGKRRGRFKVGGGMRDHPRLCGEKSPYRTGKTVLLGSPPPMRGKEH